MTKPVVGKQAKAPQEEQYKTPPEISREVRCSPKKVINLIRAGEIEAIDMAPPGSLKPRYLVSPQALERFKQSRRVVPDGGLSTTQRLRRKATASGIKEFF